MGILGFYQRFLRNFLLSLLIFSFDLEDILKFSKLLSYPHQILRPSCATEKVERKGLTVVSVAIQSRGLS